MRDGFFKHPQVTPFVECPNCGRLVEFGAEHCPACREVIEKGYALLSVGVVAFNTQAVSLANTIKAGDVGAVIFLAVSAYVYFVDASDGEFALHPLWVATLVGPVLALAAVALWFFRYGRFRMGDADFDRSRLDMRWSLMLWLALLFAQAVAFATLHL
jgi:hypothetical protein